VAARAAIHAVDRLQQHFGVRPERLVAAVGPSIGPCCYEVGEDTRLAFRAQGHAPSLLDDWFTPAGGRYRLDLWRAVRNQLEGAGLMPTHIFCAELCTMTNSEVFFSYRRDKEKAGRLGAFIAIRN
jgi:copper oxidase (laccase) domain-containing protein